MPIKVIMPQLGESVVEGTVTRWLHQEGELIHEFETLLEINTDKVDTEIPSPGNGTLLKILVPEGETVRAGTVIAWIGQHGENIPGRDSDLGFISPIVARLAREKNVELSQVIGTGSGGRITKKDILDYLEAAAKGNGGEMEPAPAQQAGREQAPVEQVENEVQEAWETPVEGDLFKPTELIFGRPSPAKAGEKAPSGEEKKDVPLAGPAQEQVVPLSAVRRAIAGHMVRSVQTSPHVTTVMEADLSQVVAHRAAHEEAYARRGVRLTYTPYFIAAAVEALKAYPIVNSSWSEAGIQVHPTIHIGMATSLGEEGLIVPVIKGADNLSLSGLARAVNDLAERARSHRLAPDEVQDGTFTITNHGVSGSLFATPIINQPQCAILGIGAIQKRVVVIQDAIAIRPMAYLSLAFDHRILDGASADIFLAKVVEILQNWQEG
ncbi:MAG TPA: dihydrolipoamide acetyltransferase family protein [Anaerolineaceae bacterium]|nr:dihydrolipoamide acetyltransferase family protein [Anaerolineaceae bacterium]